MPRSNRFLVALLALGLVAAACSSGEDESSTASTSSQPDDTTTTETPATTTQAEVTTETPVEPKSSVDWEPCEFAFGDVECATIQVPLDYESPDGDQIDIAMARIRATGPAEDVIGPLVFNPGGPGFGGVADIELFAGLMSPEILERFDFVTFDPRGTGGSTAVECNIDLDNGFATIEAASDEETWAGVVASNTDRLATCTPETFDLAPHLGTMNVARDLDLVREAVEADTISYLGYSYGTRLGATYAELFPSNVRAMIFDAAVLPDSDWSQLNAQQGMGLEMALENFAEACDSDTDCPLAESGSTLDTINALRQRILDEGPLESSYDERELAVGEYDVAIVTALYSKDQWQPLADALNVAESSGDGGDLHFLTDEYAGLDFFEGGYTSALVTNTLINCADDPTRRTEDEQRAVSEQIATEAGLFGPLLRASVGCLGVPETQSPLEFGPAEEAPTIVVIGNTGDPATPYEWSVALDDMLADSVLYTVEAEGHTAYGFIDCVRAPIDAYLLDLVAPEPGATCSDNATADFFIDFEDFED